MSIKIVSLVTDGPKTCYDPKIAHGRKYVYLLTVSMRAGSVKYAVDAYVDNRTENGIWIPCVYAQYNQGSYFDRLFSTKRAEGSFTETAFSKAMDFVAENWWTIYLRLNSAEAKCL